MALYAFTVSVFAVGSNNLLASQRVMHAEIPDHKLTDTIRLLADVTVATGNIVVQHEKVVNVSVAELVGYTMCKVDEEKKRYMKEGNPVS